MRQIFLFTFLLVVLMAACSSGRTLRSRNRSKGYGTGGCGCCTGGGTGGQKGGRGRVMEWFRKMRQSRGCRRPLIGRNKGSGYSSEKGGGYSGYSGYKGYTGYTGYSGYTGYTGYATPTVTYWNGGYSGKGQTGYGCCGSQGNNKGYTGYSNWNTGYTGYNTQKGQGGYSSYEPYKGYQPTVYPSIQVQCCQSYPSYSTQKGGYSTQNTYKGYNTQNDYSQQGYGGYTSQKGFGDHSTEYLTSFTQNYQKPLQNTNFYIPNTIDSTHSSEFSKGNIGDFKPSIPITSFEDFNQNKGSTVINKSGPIFGSIETNDNNLVDSSTATGFTPDFGSGSGKITLSGIQSSSKL